MVVSLTPSAKAKLKQELQNQKKNKEEFIRIAPSSDPQQLGFLLDTQKEGDLVIKDSEGAKLLIMDQDLARILSGVVLDYVDTGQGTEFVVISS